MGNMCKTQKDTTKQPPVLQTDPAKMRGSTKQIQSEVNSDSLQTTDAYAFQNKLGQSHEDPYSPKDT